MTRKIYGRTSKELKDPIIQQLGDQVVIAKLSKLSTQKVLARGDHKVHGPEPALGLA